MSDMVNVCFIDYSGAACVKNRLQRWRTNARETRQKAAGIPNTKIEAGEVEKCRKIREI